MVYYETFVSVLRSLCRTLGRCCWRDGGCPQTMVPSLIQSQVATAAPALHFPNSRLSGTVYIQCIPYQQCCTIYVQWIPYQQYVFSGSFINSAVQYMFSGSLINSAVQYTLGGYLLIGTRKASFVNGQVLQMLSECNISVSIYNLR
jgi:hypothetical protein